LGSIDIPPPAYPQSRRCTPGKPEQTKNHQLPRNQPNHVMPNQSGGNRTIEPKGCTFCQHNCLFTTWFSGKKVMLTERLIIHATATSATRQVFRLQTSLESSDVSIHTLKTLCSAACKLMRTAAALCHPLCSVGQTEG